eukprot:scaffold115984_cov35-Tisochrysis_lutea.AAC.1
MAGRIVQSIAHSIEATTETRTNRGCHVLVSSFVSEGVAAVSRGFAVLGNLSNVKAAVCLVKIPERQKGVSALEKCNPVSSNSKDVEWVRDMKRTRRHAETPDAHHSLLEYS